MSFFYNQSISILSGHFDIKFWGHILPRIGCAEPSVQHAMIALASLQECYLVSGEPHLESMYIIISREPSYAALLTSHSLSKNMRTCSY